MFKQKKTDEQTIESLFSEFVHELNEHSTNGVVKKLDIEKVLPIAEHFFEQCATYAQRMELEDRIRIFLVSKLNYSTVESHLIISDAVEKNIRQRIREALKEHFRNAAKYAGFVFHWAVLKPVKFFKAVLEPIAVNTVLTYSIAVHPMYVNTINVQSVIAQHAADRDSHVAVETAPENNFKIQSVKQYSQQDLDNLSGNWTAPRETKKAVTQPIKGTAQTLDQETALSNQKKAAKELRIDLERRIMQQANAATIVPKNAAAVSKRTFEQRPIGDVQHVISDNDQRIFICYQSYKRLHPKKSGHVSVKFIISPKGTVKDVAVTYNSFNEELGERIVLYMKSFRFAEIDSKLGEQTIYHSFYF